MNLKKWLKAKVVIHWFVIALAIYMISPTVYEYFGNGSSFIGIFAVVVVSDIVLEEVLGI